MHGKGKTYESQIEKAPPVQRRSGALIIDLDVPCHPIRSDQAVKQIKQKPRAQTPGVSVNRIGYTVTPIVFPATHVVKHYGWTSSTRFTPFDTFFHVRRKERSERGDVSQRCAVDIDRLSNSFAVR